MPNLRFCVGVKSTRSKMPREAGPDVLLLAGISFQDHPGVWSRPKDRVRTLSFSAMRFAGTCQFSSGRDGGAGKRSPTLRNDVIDVSFLPRFATI